MSTPTFLSPATFLRPTDQNSEPTVKNLSPLLHLRDRELENQRDINHDGRHSKAFVLTDATPIHPPLPSAYSGPSRAPLVTPVGPPSHCFVTAEEDNEATCSRRELDFERFCKSHNWEHHATALECTLVVSAHTTKHQYPVLDDPEGLLGEVDKRKLVLNAGIYRAIEISGVNSNWRQRSCSHGKSPFPKLENFIVDVLGRRNGLEGSIGTYSLGTREIVGVKTSAELIKATISFGMFI